MKLQIRFQGGTRAGEIVEFDRSVDRVMIGRDDSTCQVVFPEDERQVGREHCALERSFGAYRIVTSPRNAVFVEDDRASSGQELALPATLRLGRNGPRLLVDATGSRKLMPTADTIEPEKGARTLLGLLQRQTGRLRAAIVLVCALVVGTGGLGLAFFAKSGERLVDVVHAHGDLVSDLDVQRANLDETTSDLVAMADRFQDLDARFSGDLEGMDRWIARIDRTVDDLDPHLLDGLRGAAESVYLVGVRDADGNEAGVGTAWVVGDGTLATNAHVADAIESLEPGQTLFVRANHEPYRDHRVLSVKLHPGYRSFQTLWSRYKPALSTIGNRGHRILGGIAAADVALMYVDGGEQLASPLEVASIGRMESLEAGDAAAFVGYPMERMALAGVNLREPTPTSQAGRLTATTDSFLGKGEVSGRYLLHFSMPVTGGASGSPILDSEGAVIGLVSAMNATPTSAGGRLPLAVGIAYGQRADLLQELLDGVADERQRERDQQWTEELRQFVSLQEEIFSEIQDRYFEAGRRTVVLERTVGETEADERFRGAASVVEIAIDEPGDYVIVAISDHFEDIDIGVFGEEIVPGSRPMLFDSEDDGHPAVRVVVDGPVVLRVVVLGGEPGIGYELRAVTAAAAE